MIEIEKIQIAKNKCTDDPIAIAELDSYLNNSKISLNQLIQSSFYGEDSTVKWFFDGKEKRFKNSREMNHTLSYICGEVYPFTPILKNELINRERISAAISLAKKNLLELLLKNADQTNLGFDETRFPPEKTIYLTLINRTGIHQKDETGKWLWGRPQDVSFHNLWDESERFLRDCSIASKKLTDFIDLLRAKLTTSRRFKLTT